MEPNTNDINNNNNTNQTHPSPNTTNTTSFGRVIKKKKIEDLGADDEPLIFTTIKKKKMEGVTSSNSPLNSPPLPLISISTLNINNNNNNINVEHPVIKSPITVWTSHDDLLLKEAMQCYDGYSKVAKSVRFSVRFTAQQIEERWNQLLYDSKVASQASLAMLSTRPLKKVVWSEQEEMILLREVDSKSFNGFQQLLEKYRSFFHSCRTPKSLEKAYKRLKKATGEANQFSTNIMPSTQNNNSNNNNVSISTQTPTPTQTQTSLPNLSNVTVPNLQSSLSLNNIATQLTPQQLAYLRQIVSAALFILPNNNNNNGNNNNNSNNNNSNENNSNQINSNNDNMTDNTNTNNATSSPRTLASLLNPVLNSSTDFTNINNNNTASLPTQTTSTTATTTTPSHNLSSSGNLSSSSMSIALPNQDEDIPMTRSPELKEPPLSWDSVEKEAISQPIPTSIFAHLQNPTPAPIITFSEENQEITPNQRAHLLRYRKFEHQHQQAVLRAEREYEREKEKERDPRALALLRGKRLRYYMKSKEIVVGRETPGLPVDLDLGPESNKVSRRHCVIKLKCDGEFYLKNLGKRNVYMNGMCIPPGSKKRLRDNCVVNICGVQFVFEINKVLWIKIKRQLLS